MEVLTHPTLSFQVLLVNKMLLHPVKKIRILEHAGPLLLAVAGFSKLKKDNIDGTWDGSNEAASTLVRHRSICRANFPHKRFVNGIITTHTDMMVQKCQKYLHSWNNWMEFCCQNCMKVFHWNKTDIPYGMKYARSPAMWFTPSMENDMTYSFSRFKEHVSSTKNGGIFDISEPLYLCEQAREPLFISTSDSRRTTHPTKMLTSPFILTKSMEFKATAWWW